MIIPAHLKLATSAEFVARRQVKAQPATSPATQRAFRAGARIASHRAEFEMA